MERYDYYSAVKEDVINAINEDYTEQLAEVKAGRMYKDDFVEMLNEDLWANDSVTGNASGSYYCNAWKADEAIAHNLDLLGEALTEFGCTPDYLMKEGAEACDVAIRCYLLNQSISESLNELLDE